MQRRLSVSGTGGAQSGQTPDGATASPSNATASGYASYGSTYDDFSKTVYNNSVGVGGQGEKVGGVSASTGPSVGAAGSADLGPNVYGKTNSQLDKINVR